MKQTVGAGPAIGDTGSQRPMRGRPARPLQVITRPFLGAPAWVYLTCLVAPALLLLVLSVQPFVPIHIMLMDTTAAASVAYYYGFLSNMGILLWCTTAAVCLFAAAVVFHRTDGRGDWAFLFSGGALTAILMFDDLLLIHESIVPAYLGVEQEFVIALYGILTLGYLTWFFRNIMASEFSVLVISLSLFSVSVASDQILDFPDGDLGPIVEDGSKFLAISLWAGFHIRTAWLCVTRAPAGPLPDKPD